MTIRLEEIVYLHCHQQGELHSGVNLYCANLRDGLTKLHVTEVMFGVFIST